jgi:hypothetical protein
MLLDRSLLRTALGALACMTALARPAWASDLLLGAGSRQLGGQATVKVSHSTQGTAETATHVALNPGAGWFILDGLELRVGIGFDVLLENGHANSGVVLSGDVGVRWFYQGLGSLVPYVGAAVGPSWSFTNTDDTAMTLAMSVPVGMLFAFNPHVALDVGARLDLDVGLQNAQGTTAQLALGYFGVQAFF